LSTMGPFGPAQLLALAQSLRQQLIALGERVTGVGIECAGQRLRLHVCKAFLGQPRGDAVTQLLIRGAIFLRHHVFIERTDDHEHVVAALAENFE